MMIKSDVDSSRLDARIFTSLTCQLIQNGAGI